MNEVYIFEEIKIGQKRKLIKEVKTNDIIYEKGINFTINKEIPYLVKRNGKIIYVENPTDDDKFVENYDGFYECICESGEIVIFSGPIIKMHSILTEYNGFPIEELRYASLADGRKVIVPPIINISEKELFNQMKDKIWDVVKEYLELIGLRLETQYPSEETITKEVQNTILNVLKKSGINLDKKE